MIRSGGVCLYAPKAVDGNDTSNRKGSGASAVISLAARLCAKRTEDLRDRSAQRLKPPRGRRSPHISPSPQQPGSSFRLRAEAGNVSEDGIGDEGAAAAPFEVVEGVDLPGHFKLSTIDRVVPALDIDGALEPAPA